ncbi:MULTISPECIES: CsbD family protein [Streptomyces]|uniref:CsbD family protein n=1 Tax=Streptomyces maoxianensis TaxID=1459942 RepID=A0ABV9GDS2_9ACTN|nr:CsbD family protein [Streptomyces sp. ISL-1]MBT2392108.1 CsbD family protein [Streptomyces sp. ISL-1]
MRKNEKTRAKVEQAEGKVKEGAGRAVGNERLTAEGRAEQSQGDVREAKEKMKGGARKAKDAFKR